MTVTRPLNFCIDSRNWATVLSSQAFRPDVCTDRAEKSRLGRAWPNALECIYLLTYCFLVIQLWPLDSLTGCSQISQYFSCFCFLLWFHLLSESKPTCCTRCTLGESSKYAYYVLLVPKVCIFPIKKFEPCFWI